ncbi:MAG: Fe-S protein assembly co-chaperone HscB [Magnetococcales bacterium]|nr:Fe-S protein assembly co-chaperone HscB [Magnetococcales bacterium]
MNPTLPLVCWSCRGPTPAGLFCTTCSALLPPDPNMDCFRLFGLEPLYELDLPTLETRQRTLQKQLHPDFFAQRSATERRLSLEWTTRINEASQILTDPVARAGYLLSRLGWQADRPAPDPEFLEEVMTLREILEEVDPASPDALAKLAVLKTEARARLQADQQRVSAGFQECLSGAGQEALAQTARHVDRMRYHRRYLEELDRLEDRAFDPDN